MIDKYLDLVTSQHRDKPKFIAWLSAPLEILDDIVNLDITTAFDLDNAVGAQQDILGTIIGRKRTLDFQPSDGSAPVLEDTTYELALKAKIAQNQWDGTIDGMLAIWSSLFPDIDLYVTDNQDMSIKASIIGMAASVEQDLVNQGYVLPKPQGVSVAYEFGDIDNLNIYFGIVFHDGTFETITQVV
jgi:hypothetical protein